MKLVVFGLAVSSSWGNGHATLWRGLIAALARDGHRVVFFERDREWYAASRDLTSLPNGELVIYPSWADVSRRARAHLADCDAAVVTSYCPDATDATALVSGSRGIRAYYDLDAPITLEAIAAGRRPDYLPPQGLGEFDLVLSYTGGKALEGLRDRLGARRVAPLFGSVDPAVHQPSPGASPDFRLSYLGTYAADRQAALSALFLEPARHRPELRFLVGGSQFPEDFPWGANVHYRSHVPPADHPAFYGDSSFTLNVTRAAMAECGWCPSARLFEAAACGVPVISDAWEGLEKFFVPGREILVARHTDDVLDALSIDEAERLRLARDARERTLAEHTADVRARELVDLLEVARRPGA